MSEEKTENQTRGFVDALAVGDNAKAGEAFKSSLRSKFFSASVI